MRVVDHKPRPQRVVGQLVRIDHGEQHLFAAPRRHHDPARAGRIRHQPFLAVQPTGAVQRRVRLRREPVFRFEFGHGCGLPARDRRQHLRCRVIFGAPQQLRGEQAGQQGRAHQHPPHALQYGDRRADTEARAPASRRQTDAGPAHIHNLAPKRGIVFTLRLKMRAGVAKTFFSAKAARIVEQHRLLVVEAQRGVTNYGHKRLLLRQAEHALGHDVGLNLAGATADGG